VNTKNILDRFFIQQINASSSYCYLSKVLLPKRSLGYAKVIQKKRRKKEEEKKNRQVSEISTEKREMNNIAHVFLQRYFYVSKDRYVFKEHSRIRLATIHTHAHLDLIV
jgi:hypothetical protein